jgi:hypothetical protein
VEVEVEGPSPSHFAIALAGPDYTVLCGTRAPYNDKILSYFIIAC